MRRIALLAIVAGFVVPLMASAPAHAQATRTWVSGVGDDANPCSRTAPCKTFAGAISKTAAAGEINCLDPGGFGAVTITKSITISCEAGTAGVLVSGTNGIVISAATTDSVYLKGLDFEGVNTGLNAIVINSAALVQIDDCVIRRFTGFGIQVKPSATSFFAIRNVSAFANGGGGIQVRPTGGFTSGTIDHSVLDRNGGGGLLIDGSGGGTGSAVSVRESTMTGNGSAGILSASANSNTSVISSTLSNNVTGITANSGIVRIGSSIISGNTTSVVGGGVQSYGNNQVNGNTTDTVPGAVPGGLH
jgi:hypothetical protein